MRRLDSLLAELFNKCASLLDYYHQGNMEKLKEKINQIETTIQLIKESLNSNVKYQFPPNNKCALTYNGCPRCEGD